MATRNSDWVRRYWDRSAAMYDRSIGFFERFFLADGREWLGSQARGETLEVGVGTGRNLPFYPADIRLIGVDLSPEMLDRAKARARELGREVDLRVGDAEHLEFADGSVDTVVFSLSLCSVVDDRQAIREAKRVLRPGGRLALLEHVRSPRRWVRAIELLMDFFSSRLQADHMLREPLRHLRAEGLEIETVERSKAGVVERTIARKPSEAPT